MNNAGAMFPKQQFTKILLNDKNNNNNNNNNNNLDINNNNINKDINNNNNNNNNHILVENTFLTNYLGPFVLTISLLPILVKTSVENNNREVRIVNVASRLEKKGCCCC